MKTTSPQEFLDSVCTELGYKDGALYNANDDPNKFLKEEDQKVWIEKGEWLSLAKQVDAEKIFFVDNNPVIVFKQTDKNESDELRKIFNDIWCMSRPRLLFLAMPGELAVYDLANKPAQSQKDWEIIKPLAIARSVNEVAEKLNAFRREQIESGRLFEEEMRFGDLKNRADKALIHDLKEIRSELIEKGLSGKKVKYAHALIGRSIFIRYLEDRGILLPKDFQELASKRKEWKAILENETTRTGINLSDFHSLYARVLSDKDFTFALFEKLAKVFNGDMFPDIEEEKNIITQTHLELIQDLLFGNTGKEKLLFFYAYRFEIIPIELISSIYEEFYHPEANKEKNKKSSEGAYYTPPALVEFLVNQVLTPERLKTKPRVLDPACGSGIFLVEAFRRIVRHRCLELGRKPNFQNLQVILREQIAGIEINPEAIRIAAFSLYLAMLHYLDPPSIREQIYERGNRLPNLVFEEGKQKEISYNILLAKNAFDSEYFENNLILQKSFLSNCADIIIGNPPWGSPGTGEGGREAREANKMAIDWCYQNNLSVGDQERSQTFIWRTLDLLSPKGIAGLLVSTGVFFKHQKNSVKFREQWLSRSTLSEVFNFVHTRKIFFSGAISPFAAIVFYKDKPKNSMVSYWSSKKTAMVENLISVIFYKNDLKMLPYEIDELKNHQTWKILWWGGYNDYRMIRQIKSKPFLKLYSPKDFHGQGFTEAKNEHKDSGWLKLYKEFPSDLFGRYGPLNKKLLIDVPSKVKRKGKKRLYTGDRILVKRGISESEEPKGIIIARYETKDFCFRNSIHGIKMQNQEEWKYKVLLGILWSSLVRYYFFLTSSNWGIWHDEIHLEDELMQLPICFPTSASLKERIVAIVDKLRTSTPEEKGGEEQNIFQPKRRQNVLSQKEVTQLEKELDEAIFELYELSDVEVDLIREMCEINLPYYYSPETSPAGKPILVTGSLREKIEMAGYIKMFCQYWEAYLDTDAEFCWKIHHSDKNSMIAMEFLIQKKGEKAEKLEKLESWNDVLTELDKNLIQPFYSSRIYLEGMVRVVTNDYIIIIKRNEKRLWTRNMAREDAEATLVQAMNLKSRGEETANE